MNKRIIRSIVACAGWLGLVGAGASVSAAVEIGRDNDFRSSDRAPVTWLTYAHHVQDRVQEWLASDSDSVHNVRRSLAIHLSANGDAQVVAAKVWIMPTGRIERLVFDGLDDDIANRLRAILTGGNVTAPPPDMLQPVHLRLSLGQPG